MNHGSIRAWASRSAGVIGMSVTVLYLAIITGQDEGFTFWASFWLLVMFASGLLGWFADRTEWATGRKMLMVALTLFVVLGVLLSNAPLVSLLLLLAAILSLVGFAGTQEVTEDDS